MGRPTRDVLSEIVVGVANAIPWPKSMRWAQTSFRWVRPLHAVLAIFDGAPLSGGLDTGDGILEFTDQTAGHRFHAPALFAVRDFADYEARLRDARVITDSAAREQSIREQLAALCADAGFQVPDDDGLYAEVAGLVEWPRVLIGSIDPAFMALPAEVLVSSMREHQKYFGLKLENGEIAPSFAFVSNIEADDPAAVVAGNERVLRARLSDAKYFWDQDLKIPLEEMARDRLSRQARQCRRQGRAGRGAGHVVCRRDPRRQQPDGWPRRASGEGGPRQRLGWGIPRSAGHHGALLCDRSG